MIYDVTIITVRPNAHPQALARLKEAWLPNAGGELLACWYSDLGALNKILLLRTHNDEARARDERAAMLQASNPFGIADLIVDVSMDSYAAFPFLPVITPGARGPIYEVRSYMLKPDGLERTIELWRAAVPGRSRVSPVLAALYSVSGKALRFMHIWPYPSLDERARLRAKAVAEGVWPPPGGPDLLVSQQADIFLPADFSPLR